jgi:hypothetical protein
MVSISRATFNKAVVELTISFTFGIKFLKRSWRSQIKSSTNQVKSKSKVRRKKSYFVWMDYFLLTVVELASGKTDVELAMVEKSSQEQKTLEKVKLLTPVQDMKFTS